MIEEEKDGLTYDEVRQDDFDADAEYDMYVDTAHEFLSEKLNGVLKEIKESHFKGFFSDEQRTWKFIKSYADAKVTMGGKEDGKGDND